MLLSKKLSKKPFLTTESITAQQLLAPELLHSPKEILPTDNFFNLAQLLSTVKKEHYRGSAAPPNIPVVYFYV